MGLVVGVILGIQYYASNRELIVSVNGNYNLDEAFTAASFLYGPEGWVPYNTKLPVQPGGSVDGDAYCMMFVDLNATSNVNSTFPCVRVDYAFSGLHGIAAFHVYGYIHANGGISWTNRVDGLGANGWYVVRNKERRSPGRSARRRARGPAAPRGRRSRSRRAPERTAGR